MKRILAASVCSAILAAGCVHIADTSPTSAPVAAAAPVAPVAAQTEALPPHAHAHPHVALMPARELVFPDARDGRKILSVDLHTHSVFSDGHVWPTVRTWEAKRDGLAAMAVTEHLEYQPRQADIPHPDRNRAFQVASESAKQMNSGLIVIPGVEVTRKLPPGHVNAVFIKDANPILTMKTPAEDNIDTARTALGEAVKQGAFTFWNHAWWGRDFPNGVLVVPETQIALFRDGLIKGMEIANGDGYSDEAFQAALDHNLVILGVSDIHGLIDYDYNIPAGEHRTTSLVLAKEQTGEAIKQALFAGDTVALYAHQILGRPQQVEAVVQGALTLVPGKAADNRQVLPVTIRNDAPVRFVLRNVGKKRFGNSADIVVVPAHGEATLQVTGTANADGLALEFEVLSAFVAPQTAHRTTLRPR